MACIASGSQELTDQHNCLKGLNLSEHQRPVIVAEDPAGKWQILRQLAPDGAMLVRPDGHIAWRCHSLAEAHEQDNAPHAVHSDGSIDQPRDHRAATADGSVEAASLHAQAKIEEELLVDRNSAQAPSSHLASAVADAIRQYSSKPDRKLACRLIHDAMRKLLG